MPLREWRPRQIWQRIRAHGFDTPELRLDPGTVRDQFISNLWQKTITYIWGVKDGVSFPVKVAGDGSLRVHTYGAGFTTYSTASGTATDAYPGAATLSVTAGAHRWDFLIETNDATISFLAADGSTWLNDIPLVKGFYSIPFTSTGVRIKNRTAGSNSDYYIQAYR